jgi:Fic-DOC domain mobile mystery protein B
MTPTFDDIPDATPLDPDSIAGLKLSYVTNQAELNLAEEANILAALNWSRRRKDDPLQLPFVLELHRRMFGDVWSWAGTWRRTQTNVGVTAGVIPARTLSLLDDVRYWVSNATYSRDEIAIRLHHQLVAIHPFANGNGRHTRLLADLLARRLGSAPFTWGGRSLSAPSDIRRTSIAALRQADQGDIRALLVFARS